MRNGSFLLSAGKANWLLPLLVLVALRSLSAIAQPVIGIALESDLNRYVRYELMQVTVTIRNYSGNSLSFGTETSQHGQLEFLIESDGGFQAPKLDPKANPVADLILSAGETRRLTIGLNQVYDMQREGIFTVSAQIGHERLPNDYRSNSLTIEIRDGVPVWTRTFGLPSGSKTEAIQTRTASLLLFHNSERNIYCLRIEDDTMVYGITRLGPRIGGTVPACDVDAMSNIHTFIQVRSRFYSYRVYDRNAKLVQDKYYMAEESLPQLTRDSDVGRVMVVGGRPAVPGVDFHYAGERQDSVAWDEFRPIASSAPETADGRKEGGGGVGGDKAALPSPPVGEGKGRSRWGKFLNVFRGKEDKR
ncbi:MAG: hypothetical protein HON70_08770 [Lentisphaerae bacterium]|nr:hypothetical protein [Lentisphaerota bacterium]